MYFFVGIAINFSLNSNLFGSPVILAILLSVGSPVTYAAFSCSF